VTHDGHNLLFELGNRPASQVLAELYHSLNEADQARMRDSLLLGIANTEIKDPLEPHEFLMRNIVQMDHEKSILAIGNVLRSGQTVQVHLRDTEAANEELDLLLKEYSAQSSSPRGALLFTCTGRGQRLFSETNYESDAFFNSVGHIPLTGFFCSGEIGPVGHSTHLHGYTSSFGLFHPARQQGRQRIKRSQRDADAQSQRLACAARLQTGVEVSATLGGNGRHLSQLVLLSTDDL